MALPTSGQLSLSMIAIELGASTPYSLRGLSSLAGKSTPDAVSEFYGYSGVISCNITPLLVNTLGNFVSSTYIPSIPANKEIYLVSKTISITDGTTFQPTFVLDQFTEAGVIYTYKQVIVLQGTTTLYDSGDNLVTSTSVTLTPTIIVTSYTNIIIQLYTSIYYLV